MIDEYFISLTLPISVLIERDMSFSFESYFCLPSTPCGVGDFIDDAVNWDRVAVSIHRISISSTQKELGNESVNELCIL